MTERTVCFEYTPKFFIYRVIKALLLLQWIHYKNIEGKPIERENVENENVESFCDIFGLPSPSLILFASAVSKHMLHFYSSRICSIRITTIFEIFPVDLFSFGNFNTYPFTKPRRALFEFYLMNYSINLH